jgi:hypothetical protein
MPSLFSRVSTLQPLAGASRRAARSVLPAAEPVQLPELHALVRANASHWSLRWSLRSHTRCHSLAPGSGTCARVMSRATFRPVPQGRFAPAFCAAQSVHGAASRRQLRSFSSRPGTIVWVLLWRLVSKAKLWLATSRALTPQSTGRPTAGFARRRPPVTSNVRPRLHRHDHDHLRQTPRLPWHPCAAFRVAARRTLREGNQQRCARSYRQLLARCPSESSNCSNPHVLRCCAAVVVLRSSDRFVGHR